MSHELSTTSLATASHTQLVESVLGNGSSTTSSDSSHWKSLETWETSTSIGNPGKHHKNIGATGPKSSVYWCILAHILKHLKLRYSMLQHVTAHFWNSPGDPSTRSCTGRWNPHRNQPILSVAPIHPGPFCWDHESVSSRSLLSRFHSGVFQRGTWWNDVPRGLSLAPKHLSCAGTWVLIIKTLRFRVWLADMGTWGQAPSSDAPVTED